MTLAGEEAGEGVPVVLLHGLTATRRYVVMGSQGARARRAPRGRLRRARPRAAREPAPDAYGYDALAADLLAVLDDRGIDRAVLAGASMGAHTIARFALDHPERVAALVVDHARPSTRSSASAALERWDALAAGLRDGGVEGFVEAYGEPRRAGGVARDGAHRAAPAPVRARAPGGGGRRAARGAALAPVRARGTTSRGSTCP